MSRPIGPARGIAGFTILAILVGLIALPVLAADPSVSPSATAEATPASTAEATPSATAAPTPTPASTPAAAPAATAEPEESEEPDESGKPDKAANPNKPDKAEKGPEVAVTMTGTVGTRTDADGRTEYTLAAGGKVIVLDGGPSWFYGDNHPLKAYVGKRVTITGSQRAGEDELEVDAVDGKALRAPGKPPWAGGWKRVGAKHPGWTQEKWDRWQGKIAGKAKAFGADCWPPGHCKDKSGKNPAASDDMTGADAGG